MVKNVKNPDGKDQDFWNKMPNPFLLYGTYRDVFA